MDKIRNINILLWSWLVNIFFSKNSAQVVDQNGDSYMSLPEEGHLLGVGKISGYPMLLVDVIIHKETKRTLQDAD